MSGVTYSFVKELLFNNCFLLCLLQPAFYIAITGVDIPPTVRNNLASIATKIRTFVEDHATFSAYYTSVTNITPELYVVIILHLKD